MNISKIKISKKITFAFFFFIFFFIINNVFSQNEKSKVYTFGISQDLLEGVDVRDAKIAVELWTKMNAEKYIEVDKTEVTILNGIEDIINTYNKQSFDVLYITPLSYYLIKDKINLEPVLRTQLNNKDFYKLLLLGNKNKKHEGFADFKDKKILLQGGRYKLLTELWLDLLCKQNGIDNKSSFFKEITFSDKPIQTVLPVVLGQYDACIVNDGSFDVMTEMNPQISKSLNVHYQRPKLINDLVCINKNLNAKEREMILSITHNFDNLLKNEQVNALFKSKGATLIKKGDFDGIDGLIKDYKKYVSPTLSNIEK